MGNGIESDLAALGLFAAFVEGLNPPTPHQAHRDGHHEVLLLTCLLRSVLVEVRARIRIMFYEACPLRKYQANISPP